MRYATDREKSWLAEAHALAPAGRRHVPRHFAACAACIALILFIGVSAASATGLFDGRLSYFGGETEMYLDEILPAVTSVSNDSIELRIDGAIADEHTCHMVVSFVGLTEEVKDRFAAGDLDEQKNFQLYAIAKTGERVEFSARESGTYTEKSALGKKAKTMLEDADMTYLLTGFFADGISMNDMEKVCFAYEDLVLEVNVQEHIAPEYELYPENPNEDSVTDFHVSRIGFYFTMPVGSEDDFHFDLKLIHADGTVWEGIGAAQDVGWRGDSGYSDEDTTAFVSGWWCGGSAVSIGILNLEDYCGVQVNGENYYFTTL